MNVPSGTGVAFQRLRLYQCILEGLSNSNTIACPPMRGDNTRALASGLAYVQVDIHDISVLYHLHQYGPCISGDISCSW